MRLILCEKQELEHPEVTIAYREMTEDITRVAEFVRSVDRTVVCKKESEEIAVPVSDIFYVESVDKKAFVYCESEVFQSGFRLYELENILMQAGFVRISKSALLNLEKLKGVKSLVNSRLEAILTNGERVCVSRKYLKDIKEALLRRNGR